MHSLWKIYFSLFSFYPSHQDLLNFDDPLNIEASEHYLRDKKDFEAKVRIYVTKYAKRWPLNMKISWIGQAMSWASVWSFGIVVPLYGWQQESSGIVKVTQRGTLCIALQWNVKFIIVDLWNKYIHRYVFIYTYMYVYTYIYIHTYI